MKQALWIMALMLIGLVTTGAQIDRQARVSGDLATHIPSPFRAFAQERLATRALAGGEPGHAVAEARQLVTRRPLAAEHLRTLAIAQVLSQNDAASLQTLQAASRRGWRDPITQEAVLRLAIETGNHSEAVRRYAALMAMPNTSDALLTELGEAALHTPEGRNTFAAVLAPAERWHRTFLRRGPKVLPPHVVAELIVEAQDQGARFDCAQLRQAEGILNDESDTSRLRPKFAINDNCVE